MMRVSQPVAGLVSIGVETPGKMRDSIYAINVNGMKWIRCAICDGSRYFFGFSFIAGEQSRACEIGDGD
jgi:hypothetical protein